MFLLHISTKKLNNLNKIENKKRFITYSKSLFTNTWHRMQPPTFFKGGGWGWLGLNLQSNFQKRVLDRISIFRWRVAEKLDVTFFRGFFSWTFPWKINLTLLKYLMTIYNWRSLSISILIAHLTLWIRPWAYPEPCNKVGWVQKPSWVHNAVWTRSLSKLKTAP